MGASSPWLRSLPLPCAPVFYDDEILIRTLTKNGRRNRLSIFSYELGARGRQQDVSGRR